jgi:hypothetical protein
MCITIINSLCTQVDLYTTWGKIWSCGGGGQCGTCIVQVKFDPDAQQQWLLVLSKMVLLCGDPLHACQASQSAVFAKALPSVTPVTTQVSHLCQPKCHTCVNPSVTPVSTQVSHLCPKCHTCVNPSVDHQAASIPLLQYRVLCASSVLIV